jgi:YD repeat-containing protein
VDVSGNGTALESFDGSGWRINLTAGTSTSPPPSGVMIDRNGTQYTITGFGNNSFGGCNSSPLFTQPGSGGHAPVIPVAAGTQQYCSQASIIGKITDPNGNVYALPASMSQAGTDTMGRAMSVMGLPPGAVVGTTTDSSGCSSLLPFAGANLISYPGPGGVTNQVKFCYGAPAIQTSFGVSGILEYPNSSGHEGKGPAGPLVGTVLLPDGSTWNINYDSYGNPVSIGLPLGGSITYQYATIAFPRLGTSAPPVSRTVIQRTITDNNGNSYIWKYHWMTAQSTPSSPNGTFTNITTDPLLNDTVHVFTNLNGALYETQTQVYQGSHTSGQLLRQVDTGYQVTVGVDSPTALPNSIQTTVFPSGKVSLVQKSYDAGITPANSGCTLCSTTASYGKVVTEKEYDWGSGTPGPLLRETDTTYKWQVNSDYLAAHMLDLQASVIVKDGSGCTVAETDYDYDESAYSTGATISTQHASPPAAVRGNLTTVTKWLAPASSCNPKGGTPVISHTNWYDTGEVFQQLDPLGNATTHSYDPAYLGAYSTSTCNALNQCVSGTYDFTTGLLTSFTNANATQQASGNTQGDAAHTIVYGYDLMSRLTSATFPPDPANGGAQAKTKLQYPVPITLPFTVTKTRSITPTLTDSVSSIYDGLGRAYKTQHALPNGTATVDTIYDGLDQVTSVSNPYFSTSDPTYGATQTIYDALGRATQVTKQDGSFSTVAYNVSPLQAAPGDCTQTKDEAGKQRLTCSDGLGRLIEVHEPGDNFAGTQATGTLTINGSLQSQSGIGAAGGTAATAQVTISGSDQAVTLPGHQDCTSGPHPTCTFIPGGSLYDSGTVTLTVNGANYTGNFGQNNSPDSSFSVAQAIAGQMGNDANVVVTGVSSDGVISLQARNAGAGGNSIALSTSWTYNSSQFTTQGPSFTASPVNGNLSGGANAFPGVTVYDQGTVTVSVGNFSASAAYSQSGNSTAAAIASALVNDPTNGLNRSGSPVQATLSGAGIAVTYNAVGTAGNGVSVTVSSQSTQTQQRRRAVARLQLLRHPVRL